MKNIQHGYGWFFLGLYLFNLIVWEKDHEYLLIFSIVCTLAGDIIYEIQSRR